MANATINQPIKVGRIQKAIMPDGNEGYLVEKEYFGQGYIFKDEEAYYHHKDEPCYVPEHAGENGYVESAYTGQDFLDMCGGDQDRADDLFHSVDWQFPETLMEDYFREQEWVICPKCKKTVDYGDGCNPVCPHCKTVIQA